MAFDVFTLADLVSPWVYGYLLVMCRVSGALMFAPAIGEQFIPMNIKAMLVVAISLPVALIVVDAPEAVPSDGLTIASHVAANILTGLFLGVVGRLFMAALQIAGQIMSQLMGLYAPFGANIPGFEGSSAIGTFLTLGALAIIFALDIHHLFLEALTISFELAPVYGWPDVSMLTQEVVRAMSTAMKMAFQYAAPFIVLALVFNTGMGIANRMVPVLPVYFVFSPILIASGLGLSMLIVAVVLYSFADTYGAWLLGFGG